MINFKWTYSYNEHMQPLLFIENELYLYIKEGTVERDIEAIDQLQFPEYQHLLKSALIKRDCRNYSIIQIVFLSTCPDKRGSVRFYYGKILLIWTLFIGIPVD